MATVLKSSTSVVEALIAALGARHVLLGDEDRAFFGTDVFHALNLPIAVAQPGTIDELQAVVRICYANDAPLTVRGGGASYTDGYTHAREGGITIDTSRLKRIDISEADALVTVEPGVTWNELYLALKDKGLKTSFWGPFSGLNATVGGSVSQNSISHGQGVSAQAVSCMDVIIRDGQMLSTGSSGSAQANPFFRFYGPDLTGLFTGDCGALGVKARITLPLARRREAFEAASFNFASFEAMHDAMQEVSLLTVDEENFGLDAALQQGQLGKSDSVSAKVEMAGAVMKSASSFTKGVRQLAKMAVAGDRALKQASYAVHYIVEGHNEGEARGKMAALKAAVGKLGEEIPNSVPSVVRGMPFAPFHNVLGPKGERWLPFHTLLPHSSCNAFHAALEDYRASQQAVMDQFGIYMGRMFMAVGTSAFVYEPTFYWPDAQSIYHKRTVPQDYLKDLPTYPEDSVARGHAKRMKFEIVDLMQKHGGAHLQIGKNYPLLDGRNSAAVAILRGLKAALDPKGLLNPGALGL
jgi:FAD/FMN-containing dehydrogenase